MERKSHNYALLTQVNIYFNSKVKVICYDNRNKFKCRWYCLQKNLSKLEPFQHKFLKDLLIFRLQTYLTRIKPNIAMLAERILYITSFYLYLLRHDFNAQTYLLIDAFLQSSSWPPALPDNQNLNRKIFIVFHKILVNSQLYP